MFPKTQTSAKFYPSNNFSAKFSPLKNFSAKFSPPKNVSGKFSPRGENFALGPKSLSNSLLKVFGMPVNNL